jgi:polygalacturonase
MSALPDRGTYVSVRAFGAAGDGLADDRPAIQAAIDAAGKAGGGTVLLQSGGYVSGSLFLRDGVTLHLEGGAVLLGSRKVEDYPVVESRWEGATRGVHAALVNALGAKDVALTGRGTVDGRGQEWWRLFEEGLLDRPRPRLLAFEGCERVLLEGIKALDSPSWTVNPVRCSDVVIRGLSIRNPPDSPNTDGINPDSCSRVRITDCWISVGDDCITVKSGTERERPSLRAACEHVVVSGCVLERGHGGIVIGSEMSGGVRDVVISNCVLKGTDRGIRIKTRRGRGGCVERIRASNLVMDEVLCPIAINSHYGCGAWGDAAVADRSSRPVDEGTPRLRDISISALTARGALIAAAFIDGLAESPIEGLRLDDVAISMGGDAPPERPEMAEGLPEMSRAGFWAENVRALRLSNVCVDGQRGPAWTFGAGCEYKSAFCSPEPGERT